MTFGKRQLVIAAMVVALGAAVYLNWQFGGGTPVEIASTSSVAEEKQLGQTTYVNTEVSGEKAQSSKKSEKAQTSQKSKTKAVVSTANSSLNEKQQTYFADERLKRQQNHEQAIESLSDIIESANSSESAKQEAVKSADTLAKNIKAEGDIESAIKAKGFDECLVSIDNQSCIVIVTAGKLTDATAITIKDIVNRQGGIEFDKITITEI